MLTDRAYIVGAGGADTRIILGARDVRLRRDRDLHVTITPMYATIVRRPSAFLPVVMSLLALALIAAHIATAGTAPQADEGTAARLWQLLMLGQAPIIGYFAATGVPGGGRKGLVVLAVQLLAAVTAAAPIFILGW